MALSALIPTLALVTLGAVVALAVVQMIAFLRKRRNRDAAARAFSGDTSSHPNRR